MKLLTTTLMASVFLLTLPPDSTVAQILLSPVSVNAEGDFNNDVSLVFDSDVPARGTFYRDARNVWWNGSDTSFVFDYGDEVLITNLSIAADNNDTYLVEYSSDGVNFSEAFQFLRSDGVPRDGLDLLTTNSSFPSNPTEDTIPVFVGRTFTPINARFLRVTAIDGDNANAIGEFQAFTAAPLLLSPVSVNADGDFNNDVSLVFDSDVPARGTFYRDARNVWWNGSDTSFVFDYGDEVLITNLSIAADNNDTYLVEYSSDGVNFSEAFQFLRSDGVPRDGLDLLTTNSSFPSNPTEDTIPVFVGRTFTPINARFLRVTAIDGDNANAIGEFQAFTVSPFLLGDVNQDGVVDFLDIQPFIVRLSSETFQAEADIDGNGAVEFLDIAPFIGLLSGQ